MPINTEQFRIVTGLFHSSHHASPLYITTTSHLPSINCHVDPSVILVLMVILHLGFAAAILLRSGDIHPHPGPRKTVDGNASIVLWNCNSLRGKLDEVDSIAKQQDFPLIIGLCETKINPMLQDKQFRLDGYHFLRQDRRKSKAGGGLAFYVRDDIKFQRLPSLESSSIEVMVIKVNIQNANYLILLTYRPPHTPLNHYYDKLGSVMEKSLIKTSNIVVIGDLNCDLLKSGYSRPKEYLTSFMSDFGLTNLVKHPTRPDSGTLLDVVLATSSISLAKCGVVETGASDHNICIATLRKKQNAVQPRTISYRRIKHTDFEKLNEDISQEKWHSLHTDANGNLLSADCFGLIGLLILMPFLIGTHQ